MIVKICVMRDPWSKEKIPTGCCGELAVGFGEIKRHRKHCKIKDNEYFNIDSMTLSLWKFQGEEKIARIVLLSHKCKYARCVNLIH